VDESATPPPLHSAQVVRPGSDVTLVTYGATVRTCLAAAEAAADDGRDLEVIDLRSLSPLDMGPVFRSATRTGRVVVVHEAPLTLGLGAELAARVTEQCFYALEAPVLRVTGFDFPYPPSRVEDEYLPDLDRVLDAVDRSLAY
jgi:2-oxoisovalerate dehydrogenase E1 component beta subunit